MSKTEFLKAVKCLLKGVIAQRNWLVKHRKGYLESDWCKTEIANIGHAASTLTDAQRAKAYLERKETALRYLIPTTNQKRHEELRKLMEEQVN